MRVEYVTHLIAVFVLQNSLQLAIMHSNLSVTDGVYGILSDLDVKEQISALGKGAAGGQNKKELIDLLKQLVKKYDSSTE